VKSFTRTAVFQNVFNKMFCSVVEKTLVFSALFFLSSHAIAEGGCPDGYYPANPPATNVCYPFPETENNAQTQQPQIRWANRWGAIAISSKSISGGSSVVGAATSKATKAKAQKAAIAECRSKGGAKCILKLAYYNQCAVLVWGDSGYNLVNDQTIEKATSNAMNSCSKADKNCQVYYSACSLPERVQ